MTRQPSCLNTVGITERKTTSGKHCFFSAHERYGRFLTQGGPPEAVLGWGDWPWTTLQTVKKHTQTGSQT